MGMFGSFPAIEHRLHGLLIIVAAVPPLTLTARRHRLPMCIFDLKHNFLDRRQGVCIAYILHTKENTHGLSVLSCSENTYRGCQGHQNNLPKTAGMVQGDVAVAGGGLRTAASAAESWAIPVTQSN